MSLAAVVDLLVARVATGLGAGTTVSDRTPDGAAQLPAVTLSVADVVSKQAGVGRIPRGTRTGALEVTLDVDLANPVLDLGGGETLRLVPADRRSLVLPHGPLVRADGVPDEPYTASDLEVRDTSAWTVVATTPSGKQVRPDPVAGLLRFGQPLSTSGTLRVRHRVGLWDVTVSRFQGRLVTRVAADGATLPTLVRRVAAVLDAGAPGVRLLPLAWGAGGRPAATDQLPGSSRTQELAHRFDVELEQPDLGSGGGVITDVAVTVRADRAAHPGQEPERFDVTREALT